MKYIRNRLNYFRQDEHRIENTKELNAAIKEQNDNEPIPPAETSHRVTLVVISVIVIVILVAIVIGGINFVNSFENPNDFLDSPAVLYPFIGLCIIMGLLFAGIPLFNGFRLKSKCTQEASATCIGFDDKVITNKHGAHFVSCPVYKFSECGVEYTVYDNHYTSALHRLPSLGTVVPVLFDPEDPNRCIINNKISWNTPAIFMGVVFIVLTFLFCLGVIIDS